MEIGYCTKGRDYTGKMTELSVRVEMVGKKGVANMNVEEAVEAAFCVSTISGSSVLNIRPAERIKGGTPWYGFGGNGDVTRYICDEGTGYKIQTTQMSLPGVVREISAYIAEEKAREKHGDN